MAIEYIGGITLKAPHSKHIIYAACDASGVTWVFPTKPEWIDSSWVARDEEGELIIGGYIDSDLGLNPGECREYVEA